MLLAMSTYPRNVVALQAASQENESIYSYFTQLEPGCKHLFCKLAEKDRKFNKVIVLCTPETLKGSPAKFIENSIGQKNIDISGMKKSLALTLTGLLNLHMKDFIPKRNLGSFLNLCQLKKTN